MGKWTLDMLAIVVGVVIAELLLDALRRSGHAPEPQEQGETGCF